MRAIMHGFHEPMHAPILAELIGQLDIEYLQTTYSEFVPELPNTVSAVVHHWWDLNWGDYRVDWNRLRPLDEELLTKLAGVETVFLKMADRLEQAYPQSYQQRKNLYLKHVRYWNHVLAEEQIDFYLGLNVPHETWDFVLYSLCRLHEIPTVFGFQTQVPDTILTMQDWERNGEDIGRRYSELARRHSDSSEEQIELVGRFRRDFERQTQREKPTPFYMNASPRPATSLLERVGGAARVLMDDPSLLKSRLLNPDFWIERSKRTYEARERRLLDQKMLEAYDAVATEPDLEQPFIYLALHYQPEMTTCPMAGAFVDQVLMAQLIAATMPDDVYLYVKEHPMQRTLLGRHVGYYDELGSLQRTVLVPRSFDTFELTNRCRAVATATGTVGWEALFREKPILLFGHNFYQYATGVFSIRTVDDGRSAMKRIFADGVRPTRKDVKLFLKALEDTTSEGYLTSEFGKVSQLSAERNGQNVLALLCGAVRRALTDRTTARSSNGNRKHLP
jgi:hypothetical protein